MVARMLAVTLDMAVRNTNFCHSSSVMSDGISALMPPALQASRNACARGDTLLSYSPNASRSMVPVLRMTPGRAAEQRPAPDDWRQHLIFLHAILQRDHRRSFLQDRLDGARRTLGVAQLD